MTIDEIRWITELFRVKKMSKAAENMRVSQPALSQCLQRVEAGFGFKLFERSNKGLEPTGKGYLFYEAACGITKIYDEFLVRAQLFDKTGLTSVAIGVGPHLSSYCSVDIMKKLKTLYPEIRFLIYEGTTSELLKKIGRNEIQLMISMDPLDSGRMFSHHICNISTAIYLRKGSGAGSHSYTNGGIRYLDPVQLTGETIALAKEGQSTRSLAENLLLESGVTPLLMVETSNIESMFQFAKEGVASSIGPLSSVLLQKDRATNLIYRVPEKYRWSKIKLAAYAMPEVDRLIPPRVYRIIQDVVVGSGLYAVWEDTPQHMNT